MEGDIMNQIAEHEPMIKRAMTVEDIFARNARERELYEIREKGRRDYESAMIDAKMDGREEEKREVVLAMLRENIPIDVIKRIANLSENEIISLTSRNGGKL
jgi:predicted transposase/invertase (TIGR01784 family)